MTAAVLVIVAIGLYIAAGRDRLRVYLNHNPSAEDLRIDLRRGFRRARLHGWLLVMTWPAWHPLTLGIERPSLAKTRR